MNDTVSAYSACKAPKEDVTRSELTNARHVGEHRLQVSRRSTQRTRTYIRRARRSEVICITKRRSARITRTPEGCCTIGVWEVTLIGKRPILHAAIQKRIGILRSHGLNRRDILSREGYDIVRGERLETLNTCREATTINGDIVHSSPLLIARLTIPKA